MSWKKPAKLWVWQTYDVDGGGAVAWVLGGRNVRPCLARLRRRTKVASKCRTMVDLSLYPLHHLQDSAIYTAYAEKPRTTFD